MSITKALVLIGRAVGEALDKPQQTRQVTRYRKVTHVQVQQPQKQGCPFHWHVTLFGRQKFRMEKIGFNKRTQQYVYQCTFGNGACGGKCERPY